MLNKWGIPKGSRPYIKHRTVISSIFWMLCFDAPWQDLPERYDSWKYRVKYKKQFSRWLKSGLINMIFNRLLQFLYDEKRIDWDAITLDGSNIRTLKAATGAKKHPDELAEHVSDRSRGGFGTKILLATDCTGLPLNLCQSGGQAHESQYAEILLHSVRIVYKNGCLNSRPKDILADNGYSSESLRYSLRIKRIKTVMPFKSNEKEAVTDA